MKKVELKAEELEQVTGGVSQSINQKSTQARTVIMSGGFSVTPHIVNGSYDGKTEGGVSDLKYTSGSMTGGYVKC